MTDVPAFAASSVAVYFAVRHTRGAGQWTLWVAVALAWYGFTIRQYGIVTLVAVLVTGWLVVRGDERRRNAVVVVGAVGAVAAVMFLVWWRTVPDVRSLTPSGPDGHAVRVLFSKGAGFLRLAGLSLLPVLAVVRPWARVRAAARHAPARTLTVVGFVAAWLAVSAARVPADLFVGNYLVHDGVLSDIVLIGPRVDVLPDAVWVLVGLVASVAGIVLAIVTVEAVAGVVRDRRSGVATPPDPTTVLLALVVLGYAGAYALAMLTGIQVYDRYVLPVLPAAGILLLRARAPVADDTSVRAGRSTAAGAVALAAVLLLGLAFATDSASFDGARWRAAQRAVAHGFRPREVNGGFEWRNYHRGRKLPEGRRGAGERICVTVHVDPHVAARRIVAVARSEAPTRRTMRLVAYRTRAACPTPVRP
jgi:hypothetical protein